MEVVLVNARHIKNVPGRKTDICDSKWLAGLLRHGLVKGSYNGPQNLNQLLRDIETAKGKFRFIPKKEVHEEKLQWEV
jgi:hypothetical protein